MSSSSYFVPWNSCVSIASNVLHELRSLTKKHDNVSYKVVDMSEEDVLASLIANVDVVIR
jgi:hypothetical protein